MLIEGQITALVESLARDILEKAGGGPRVSVRAGEDCEGDPLLFVDVLLGKDSTLHDASKLLYFKLRARDLLEGANEMRFPIFSFILASEHDKHAAA